MNKLYKKLDGSDVEMLLDEFVALQVFELLLFKFSLIAIKEKVDVPMTKLINYENNLVIIRDIIERLVKGEEIQSYGVNDIVNYYAVPTSLENLKEITIQILTTNISYGMVLLGLFISTTAITKEHQYGYIIDQLVSQTNSTNSATFEWWKQKIIELD